jgi:hypothetical protein
MWRLDMLMKLRKVWNDWELVEIIQVSRRIIHTSSEQNINWNVSQGSRIRIICHKRNEAMAKLQTVSITGCICNYSINSK